MEHGAAVPTAAAGAPPVAGANANANATVNNKEKEREKEKDRERERELELEAALYSNCLLLGIDQTVFHTNTNGGPRMGLFRHSNPRLGEALLHFLLCSLRGPAQSSKDFAGVWPIFDSAQSRDFRKIVQGIINELESQGALPRSNSRVSLLATCCGHRFVELLWQLSAHALREVHKRTFAADVASNPLPASLTDMVNQSSHASALLTVTKAKIALERRRFLENASTAVQRQAMWSSLAHDMTAEYRALCAEEAYLQQELEKLQISRNCKVDIEDELDQHSCLDSAMDQKNLSVARATHLWESLMTHTDQHEELASGPIEDLIAHREHRYRISGSALRAAMDHGSDVSPDEESLQHIGSFQDSGWDNQEKSVKPLENQGSDDMYTKAEERTGKPLSVDVAEILRRWTHALQRIHKQAVRLARTNDGGGTHLFKKAPDVGVNGHSEALQATLAEHTNHLNNIKALVNQLKDSMPGMEATITKLREEVDQTPLLPDVRLEDKAVLDSDAKCQDIDEESNADTPVEEDSKDAHLQLELIPPTPALKLPQLFSVSPFPGEKDVFPRNQSSRTRLQLSDAIQDFTVSSTSPPANQSKVEDMEDKKNSEISSLKKDVRNAALFKLDYYTPVEKESFGNDNGHFFMPLSSISGLLKADTNDQPMVRKPNQQISLPDNNFYDMSWEPHLQTLNESNKNQQNNGSLTGSLAQPLSPTLLSEFSSFDESYDDLLAPISEVDAAMMYSSNQVLHT